MFKLHNCLLSPDSAWSVTDTVDVARSLKQLEPQHAALIERKVQELMRRLLALWGPAERPIAFFETHTICPHCEKFFDTTDPADVCRRGPHAHTRALDELVRHAVLKRYGEAVTLFVPGAAKRSSEPQLVRPPPALTSDWLLLDSDDEDEVEHAHVAEKAALAIELERASSAADMQAVPVHPHPPPDRELVLPSVPQGDAVAAHAAVAALPHPPNDLPAFDAAPPAYDLAAASLI